MKVQFNIPASADPLIGRQRELDALAESLAGGSRLVTVHGPPGVGKSRLARELGHRLRERYAGGVWLCEMFTSRTTDEAVSHLVTALGLPASVFRGGDVGSLARALARKGEVLVLVDGLEHLVEEAGPLLQACCERAPELALVVTSQRPLGTRDERVFELSPLPPADALALFLERGRTRRPEWSPSLTERKQLERVMARLDYMPLAIELAAGWVGTLSIADLYARLDERLDLLRADACRELPDRQKTLRDTIAWSWSMLDEELRQASADLTAFRGGFGASAAEAVLAEGGALPALEMLRQLRGRGLLYSRSIEELDGEVKFFLFDNVRIYAAEHLNPASRAFDRHAAYYADAAEMWYAASRKSGGAAASRRLAAAIEDLFAAYERTEASNPPLAARLLLILDPALEVKGRLRPDTERYLFLLDKIIDRVDKEVELLPFRIRLLQSRCASRFQVGRPEDAERDAERVLALACQENQPEARERAHRYFGAIKMNRCDYAGARQHFQHAVQQPDAPDRSLHWTLQMAVAYCDVMLGDPQSRTRIEAVLAEARTRASEPDLALALFRGADGMLDLGEPHRAEALASEAEEIWRRRGEETRTAWARCIIGAARHERGKTAEAESAYRDSIAVLDRDTFATIASHPREWLGLLLLDLGSFEEAREQLATAHDLQGSDGHARICAAAAAVAEIMAEPSRARSPLSPGRTDNLTHLEQRMLTLLEILVELHLAMAAGAVSGPLRRRAREALHAHLRCWRSRVIGRMIQTRLERLDAEEAADIRLEPNARWLQLRGEERIDISRRRVLRRLLLQLVAAHREQPGVPLSPEALIRGTWPDDRMLQQAAEQRLRSAIAELRRLGLRPFLKTEGDGYLFEAGATIFFDQAAPTS